MEQERLYLTRGKHYIDDARCKKGSMKNNGDKGYGEFQVAKGSPDLACRDASRRGLIRIFKKIPKETERQKGKDSFA